MEPHVDYERYHITPKNDPVVPVPVNIVIFGGEECEDFALEFVEDEKVPSDQEEVEEDAESVGFNQSYEKVEGGLAAVVGRVETLRILLAPS